MEDITNTDTSQAGAAGDQAAAPTVIRAEPGKPWPDPPYGGRWSRDPQTGDLTLVQSTAYPSVADRSAAKAAKQAELAAQLPDNQPKE